MNTSKHKVAQQWIGSDAVPGLVSVIVPAYNAGRYLAESLESVYAQTWRPVELIVVDDGSKDDTAAIVQDFGRKRDSGFAVHFHGQQNQGAPRARNEACRMSRGEYIQFLDADDVLDASKFKHQVGVLSGKSGSDIDVVYGDAKYLVTFGDRPPREGKSLSIGAVDDVLNAMLTGQWNPPFSYLARRSAVATCGPWDETLRVNQDYDYFLRMAVLGCAFAYRAGMSGWYRKHSLATVSEQPLSIRADARERILQRAEGMLEEAGTLQGARARALAEGYRRLGRWVVGRDQVRFDRCVRKILELCPDYLPSSRAAKLVTRMLGLKTADGLLERVARLKPGRRSDDWL